MAELNKLDCEKKIRNTGTGGCPVDFVAFTGGAYVPAGKVYKKSEIADLRSWFMTNIMLADPTKRIYPLGKWEGTTKNTQDPVFAQMPSGRQVFVKESDIDVTYQFVDGGNCLNNRIRSFNNDSNWALIRWDANFKIQATEGIDEDGEIGFKGIPLKVNFAYAADENDHANPTNFRVRFAFDPYYVNEKLAYIQADFPLTELQGLIDITLELSGTPVNGVYQVIAKAGCGGGVNMYAQYATELAQTSVWKMYNDATGNEITLTSVAANAGIKGFTVTADDEDTDFTAAGPTGKVRIQLVSPSALDAEDISGYESIPLVVVRGASS